MKTISVIVGVIILVLLVILGIVFFMGGNTLLSTDKFRAPIDYTCANGKKVVAEFSDKLARITLADNRTITLEQISADDSGITYANDAGVSFSIKDFGGFVIENGLETYPGCRVTATIEDAVADEVQN
ncbi:hypothetical protein K2X83_01385 [Patescibacteria group bacterium]|nr:hypothetical protein [Patescibacteria group bacterium]